MVSQQFHTDVAVRTGVHSLFRGTRFTRNSPDIDKIRNRPTHSEMLGLGGETGSNVKSWSESCGLTSGIEALSQRYRTGNLAAPVVWCNGTSQPLTPYGDPWVLRDAPICYSGSSDNPVKICEDLEPLGCTWAPDLAGHVLAFRLAHSLQCCHGS